MSASWQQYQEDCAVLFRRLGFNAEVDKTVEGVRGPHAVDVFVSGTFCGLEIKWIVECKDWQSNIPKEKALTLLAIVQDTGADKGVLLSETGFQSGAIRTVRGTNVILTSIADLEEQIQDDFKESVLSNLSWRLSCVTERLRTLDAEAEDYAWTPQMNQQLKLFALDLAFRNALKDEYPVVYAVGRGEERLKAMDFDDLVSKADSLLRGAEEHCGSEEKKAQPDGTTDG